MRLLLTRPLAQSVGMARELRASGFRVWIAPMLRIRPLQFDPHLFVRPRSIIVTSANAVPALGAIVPASRQMFTVGPDTGLALRRAGFDNVVSASGTAAELLDLVKENWRPSDGPIVYASGQDVSLDISQALGRAGYDCSRVAVYEARRSQRLNAPTAALLADGRIDAVLFMSMRTAETFVKLARMSEVADACRSVVSVSLSNKIAAALGALSWKSSFVASSPTREGMLAEVRMLAGRSAATERRST